MTPREKVVSAQLRQLVTEYEGSIDEEARKAAFEKIRSLREVTEVELDLYSSFSSLEEFCDSLAVDKIWGNDFSQKRAIPILKEMCSLGPEDFERFDYLFSKYGQAIEFVFRKPGYLLSALQGGGKSFEEIMEDLEDSSAGPICL